MNPPTKTIVALSGIAQADRPECSSGNVSPPAKHLLQLAFDLHLAQSFDLPGTISAVSLVAVFAPPSNTIESGREGGVQAV